MAPVEMLTVEAARRRREHLLQSVGGDYQVLRVRGNSYELDARELAVLSEVEELDYLLSHSE